MSKLKREQSLGDKVFVISCHILILFVCIVTLYPFIYTLSASVSSASAIIRGEVILLPKEFTLRAYDVVMHYNGIWVAYGNTVFYTVVGTAISMLLTAMAAYPLSKKGWRMRKFFTIMITFTMWFDGGIIPRYLLLRNLGLLDTRTAILLYMALMPFYIIIMRTFFEGLPEEIEEAAKIDGANELAILFRIVVPLSKPVMATIALYYAILKWNSFFWEMIILTKEKLLPVQVLLQRIILASNLGQEMEKHLSRGEAAVPITIKYACIVVTILPIVMLYPFVQKYFVKGVAVGGVKG